MRHFSAPVLRAVAGTGTAADAVAASNHAGVRDVVRGGMARWLERAVPERAPHCAHTLEGPDDMPARIKSSLPGASLLLPVRDGSLLPGTGQGRWLSEFRARGGPRRVVATLQGGA